jgi:hypothetical protein
MLGIIKHSLSDLYIFRTGYFNRNPYLAENTDLASAAAESKVAPPDPTPSGRLVALAAACFLAPAFFAGLARADPSRAQRVVALCPGAFYAAVALRPGGGGALVALPRAARRRLARLASPARTRSRLLLICLSRHDVANETVFTCQPHSGLPARPQPLRLPGCAATPTPNRYRPHDLIARLTDPTGGGFSRALSGRLGV